MLKSKVKDLKIRLIYHEYEKKNLIDKFIRINTLNKKTNAFCFFFKKFREKKNSKTRVIRRCVLNNRSRGTLRSFGLSRICLRGLLQFGQIPGYSKAIW
jgi:small subunit ribosomal protein S14